MNYLYVAIGGAIGSSLRFVLSLVVSNAQFPLHTWLVNIVGSLILGFISFHPAIKSNVRLLIGTGAMGAFTTFSTFSYDTIKLLQNGDYAIALLFMNSTVCCGLLAAFIGMKIATKDVSK